MVFNTNKILSVLSKTSETRTAVEREREYSLKNYNPRSFFAFFFFSNFIPKYLLLSFILFSEILSVSCYSQDLLCVAEQIKVNSSCELYAKGGIKGTGTAQITSNGDIYIKQHSTAGSENWTNNASDNFLQGTGTVTFNSSEPQNITGTNKTGFYNLTVNNTGSGVIIGNDIDVTNTLLMTAGDIDLKDNSIDLVTTGNLIGETASNRIKATDAGSNDGMGSGTITAIRTLNSPSDINVAGLGMFISSSENLGATTIARGHHRQQGNFPYSTNYSIFRYYDITPANVVHTTLDFSYFECELNGHAEDELVMYRKNISGTWSNLTTILDNPSNKAEATTDNFSLFTLASSSTPLPIELINFTVKWLDNNKTQSILNWTTASEINSDYFEIQHTEDLSSWVIIGSIQASGNSSSIVNYEYIDNNPYSKITYYRLKHVDYDGSFTYSNILALTKDNTVIEIINIYPNPAENTVWFEVLSAQNTNVITYITDPLGKTVFTRKSQVVVGKNLFFIDIRHFASSTYILKVVTETGNHKTSKIFVKKQS